jgi:hypothetical protein
MSACGLEDIVCTSSSPENFAGSFNKMPETIFHSVMQEPFENHAVPWIWIPCPRKNSIISLMCALGQSA